MRDTNQAQKTMKQNKREYVAERLAAWTESAESRCAKKNTDFAAYVRDNAAKKAAQFAAEYDAATLFEQEFNALLAQGVRPYCAKKISLRESGGYKTASVSAPFTGVKPAPYGEMLASLCEYEKARHERAISAGKTCKAELYMLCKDVDDLTPARVYIYDAEEGKLTRVDTQGLVFSSITAARTGARLAYVNTCTAVAGRKADRKAAANERKNNMKASAEDAIIVADAV